MSETKRNDPIFGHEGEARVAASVVMVGMLVVLLGGAFMAIGPQLNQDRTAARRSAGATPSAPVRIIGAAPRENGPCEQQVWPNIDQRCLVRVDVKTDAKTDVKTEAKTEAKAAVAPPAPAARENDKLSPLTAAAVDHPSPRDDATTGSAVQEDTTVLRSSDTINASAPPNVTVAADNEVDEVPPPAVEQPRRRVRPHTVFPFHLHFGGFRF